MESRIEDLYETPPGGWRYEQPETGVVVKDQNFRALVRGVRLHRESNGLPTGNPEADIHTYLCGLFPDRCKISPEVFEKTSFVLRDVIAFLNTVTAAIKRRGTDAFVPQEEADRRAAICIQCPHNKKLAGCYGCQNIGKFVVQAIGNRASKWHGKLFQCGVCGCSNEAKVLLDKDLILETQAKDYTFPGYCWLSP